MDADQPRFITLESTSTQGKPTWAIWMRESDSHKYSHLVARVYDTTMADQIVELLNVHLDDV